jgi:hypothetical protein
LLRILAEHGLVPREMWVATRYGEACDRFLLARPTAARRATTLRHRLTSALEVYRQPPAAASA